jgi:hypothetical protein
MARVTGPCFSVDASGQLAKTLVFGTWKGIRYVRRYLVPFNPNTAGQQTVRHAFTEYVAHWHLVSPLEQTAWDDRAKELGYAMSGFNFYIQQSFKQNIDPDADPYVDPVIP